MYHGVKTWYARPDPERRACGSKRRSGGAFRYPHVCASLKDVTGAVAQAGPGRGGPRAWLPRGAEHRFRRLTQISQRGRTATERETPSRQGRQDAPRVKGFSGRGLGLPEGGGRGPTLRQFGPRELPAARAGPRGARAARRCGAFELEVGGAFLREPRRLGTGCESSPRPCPGENFPGSGKTPLRANPKPSAGKSSSASRFSSGGHPHRSEAGLPRCTGAPGRAGRGGGTGDTSQRGRRSEEGPPSVCQERPALGRNRDPGWSP